MKTWRIVDRPKCKAQFQFEPRDLWVGVFWRHSELALHIYVCFVPLIPLHITLTTDRMLAAWRAAVRRRVEHGGD